MKSSLNGELHDYGINVILIFRWSWHAWSWFYICTSTVSPLTNLSFYSKSGCEIEHYSDDA